VAHLALPSGETPPLEVSDVQELVPAPAAHATTTGDVPARIGFVVSGAVGPAVVRNRVRRRLRHLAADQLDRLPAGTLLVVRALPAAAGATYAQLATDLDAVLERLVGGARSVSSGRSAQADVPA